MAFKKLTGRLVLNKIPKELIKTNDKGEKYVWVDVVERRQPSQYGDTHSVQIWTKDTGTIYLGDLREKEFGSGAAAPAGVEEEEDFPF